MLDVRDVSVRFGGLVALRDVSIVVPEGRIVGLIGPNGAGKSTLFNVVTGLQRATGQVHLAGRDISGLPAHQRARLGIGRAFQNLGLMRHESVETNLMAAQHLDASYSSFQLFSPRGPRRAEARLRARAHEVATTFGLTPYLNDPIGELSFGIARFVELACVQLRRPMLMLLDEPTTGLDMGETERLLQVLRGVPEQGTTVLLVAHDVRFVMDLCDHIYVLAEGSMLFDGPPAAVQRNPAVVEAYLGVST